jgi:hypothetical protein
MSDKKVGFVAVLMGVVIVVALIGFGQLGERYFSKSESQTPVQTNEQELTQGLRPFADTVNQNSSRTFNAASRFDRFSKEDEKQIVFQFTLLGIDETKVDAKAFQQKGEDMLKQIACPRLMKFAAAHHEMKFVFRYRFPDGKEAAQFSIDQKDCEN